MKTWSLGHLADHELLRDLTALAARDRVNTADLLAHIAEVDERELYLPAAYTCMRDWCVGELRMSEDAALKRIRVARTAREYPEIFPAIADGRLHLASVIELKTYLTPENAQDLLATAANKTRHALKDLLDARFPQSERLELVTEPAPTGGETCDSVAPGPLNVSLPPDSPTPSNATDKVEQTSPGAFAMHLKLSRETHEKLHYAKDLLSHALPSGKFADVLDRALDALIANLEQKKFGVTSRARAGRRTGGSARYVSMAVRRAVHARDGGRCTFVSESGKRCDATRGLELDHEIPVALGGRPTVANLRLRCRAHNQYTAEQAYGKDFMRGKREQAKAKRRSERRDSAVYGARAREAARQRDAAGDHHADDVPGHDVLPYLNALGIRGDDAREAAARCDAIPDATLEERVKFALASRASRFMRRPAEGGFRPGAAP